MTQHGTLEVDLKPSDGEVVVSLRGEINSETSPRLVKTFHDALELKRPRVILDLKDVSRIDSTAVAVIIHGLEGVQSYGGALRLRNVSPALRRVFEVVQGKSHELPEAHRDDRSLIEKLGAWVMGYVKAASDFHHLAIESIYWTFVAPLTGKGFRVQSALDQAVFIGVNAFPIVALISFLIGLIMAMQSDYQLRQFGASIFVADLVGVALTREIAPLMTAVVVAGRSGSAIAAEIGTMKVTEEIDALQTMGFNPVKFLVAPKLFALGVTVPCLTLFADVVGIMGGLVFAMFGLQIGYGAYMEETFNALFLSDVISGLVKSFIFAMIIGQVGSHLGFIVKGGAEGVGRNTTMSVVVSIFLIVVADSIFTWFFYTF
jgi:phospholipid/cholesterol/gamma-HCH transport system permease protein